MINMKKVNLYFLISLSVGIILRVIALLFLAPNVDMYGYIEGARGIIEFDYTSHRPPGYPAIIVPFLLLTNNGLLSAKLASFSSGIALIIISYFVFQKATLKIYNNFKAENKKKASYIGLFVSAFISLNFLFIVNNGSALREDLISILVLLIFYFIIVEDEGNITIYFILAFLIVFLTLTLLTAGMFLVLGIFVFYLLCKLKWFNFKNIPFQKIGILIIACAMTVLLWLIFSYFKFGDPFYNWHSHTSWFKTHTIVDLNSIEGIGIIILRGLTIGVIQIFVSLTFYVGFFFTLLILYILKKNIKNRQVFFIFIVVGLNLAYLSIFITTPRLIMYFFSILFYIGVFPMVTIYIEWLKISGENTNNESKSMLKTPKILLPAYFITYCLRNFYLMFFFPVEDKPIPIVAIALTVSIILLIINEIIIIFYFVKNNHVEYSVIK